MHDNHDNLMLLVPLPRRFSRARIPGSLSLSLHPSTVYVPVRACSSSRCIMISAKGRGRPGGEEVRRMVEMQVRDMQ
jgi:hypothetical protein